MLRNGEETKKFPRNVSLRFQSIVSQQHARLYSNGGSKRESKYCRGVQVTRTPARVKAAKRLHAGQATRAHVTLGSFSTHGFARAAITIITGLWLCERATGARLGLRLFCEIDLTYSLAYANRQCYASEMRASLPSPSSASFRHWNRFNCEFLSLFLSLNKRCSRSHFLPFFEIRSLRFFWIIIIIIIPRYIWIVSSDKFFFLISFKSIKVCFNDRLRLKKIFVYIHIYICAYISMNNMFM